MSQVDNFPFNKLKMGYDACVYAVVSNWLRYNPREFLQFHQLIFYNSN